MADAGEPGVYPSAASAWLSPRFFSCASPSAADATTAMPCTLAAPAFRPPLRHRRPQNLFLHLQLARVGIRSWTQSHREEVMGWDALGIMAQVHRQTSQGSLFYGAHAQAAVLRLSQQDGDGDFHPDCVDAIEKIEMALLPTFQTRRDPASVIRVRGCSGSSALSPNTACFRGPAGQRALLPACRTSSASSPARMTPRR
jgi:hypothetical protein